MRANKTLLIAGAAATAFGAAPPSGRASAGTYSVTAPSASKRGTIGACSSAPGRPVGP